MALVESSTIARFVDVVDPSWTRRGASCRKDPDADPDARQQAYDDIAQLMMSDPARFLPDRAWCIRCLQMCLVFDKNETHLDGSKVGSTFKQAVLVVAGNVCVDFSSYGNLKREAVSSMMAFNTTCVRCCKYQPDFLCF